jgi:Protein of unknown function (DUF3551)
MQTTAMEVFMRVPTLAILAIVTAFTAAPARAQTYDPRYPVCLQAYVIRGGYIDCSYFSLAQCQATASGRAAQCYVNPYFAGRPIPARRYYRSRSAY